MDTSVREVSSEAVLEEKKKLRKEFKIFDMIFITIAAVIGIDTLGAISSSGAQVLTWLLISAVTFLLPYGLLTAELGTTFPQEGGVYVWCKLAGGRYFAALASLLARCRRRHRCGPRFHALAPVDTPAPARDLL